MKRKLVLAAALCLAAALSIGAAPALAADGCDCHTSATPSATPAHAPFVAGVSDCTVCHVDWVVPHPDVGPPVLRLSGESSATGYELSPVVGRAFYGGSVIAHPGVVVYLQQRLWGATAFTDLGQVTTASGGVTFIVASPEPFAAYRAVSQGYTHTSPIWGTALYRPTVRQLLPTPKLSLKFVYLKHGAVKLRKAVRARVTLTPADTGGKVAFKVQKRVRGAWERRVRYYGKKVISATGICSWKFTPKTRGLWRVQATANGPDTSRATSPWRQVRVR